MLNGTFLFKPGQTLRFRLREKDRVKPLWSNLLLLVFFHQCSRLKTRRVSPSEVACRAVTFGGSLPWSGVGSWGAVGRSVREGEKEACVPDSPSRTKRAAFVSRSWRCWRKITSL